MRAIHGIGRAQWIIPALVIWALWVWDDRKTVAARFTSLYVGIAFAAFIAQWGGEDILDNAQFDLVIATAVGIGIAFGRLSASEFARRHGVEAARATVMLVLAVRLLATFRIEPFLVLFDPAYRAEFYVNAQAAREDAVRVAAIPGPVACTVKIVCRMAGKPYVWDDFRTDMLISSGAAKGLDAPGLIRQRGYTDYANDRRADVRSLHRAIIGPP